MQGQGQELDRLQGKAAFVLAFVISTAPHCYELATFQLTIFCHRSPLQEEAREDRV
jgi:hypothetical protein